MKEINLTPQISISLIQCPENTWKKYFLATFPEDLLARVYCDVVKEYKEYSAIAIKCEMIINSINDQEFLKEMCLVTYYYPFINEILLRINSYSCLDTIRKERSDLETHINSRIKLCSNSLLFISED